jgi:hypothetical protein
VHPTERSTDRAGDEREEDAAPMHRSTFRNRFAMSAFAAAACAALAAASPARAGEDFSFAVDEAPVAGEVETLTFPTVLDDTVAPPAHVRTTVVSDHVAVDSFSAPLPSAICTGAFMLAGNWVLGKLWKHRKI